MRSNQTIFHNWVNIEWAHFDLIDNRLWWFSQFTITAFPQRDVRHKLTSINPKTNTKMAETVFFHPKNRTVHASQQQQIESIAGWPYNAQCNILWLDWTGSRDCSRSKKEKWKSGSRDCSRSKKRRENQR